MYTNEHPPERRMIDTRLPLTWLIGSVVSVVGACFIVGYSISVQTGKLDQLVQANQKMEKRLDDRDARFDAMRDSIYSVQRLTDTNTIRITALETVRK